MFQTFFRQKSVTPITKNRTEASRTFTPSFMIYELQNYLLLKEKRSRGVAIKKIQPLSIFHFAEAFAQLSTDAKSLFTVQGFPNKLSLNLYQATAAAQLSCMKVEIFFLTPNGPLSFHRNQTLNICLAHVNLKPPEKITTTTFTIGTSWESFRRGNFFNVH